MKRTPTIKERFTLMAVLPFCGFMMLMLGVCLMMFGPVFAWLPGLTAESVGLEK